MTSQVHPIVVAGVDGSTQSFVALDLAADEAVRRHQPLRVVAAFLWPALAPVAQIADAGFTDDMLTAAHRMLEEAVDRIRHARPGLEVTSTVVLGSAAGVLITESQRASVIVVGNRGHGGFASLLAGSVATQLAAHAHCPVIIVRPDADGGSSPADTALSRAGVTASPVVVGIDAEERTEAAIAFAFEEAANRGVSLTAVRIWAEPLSSGPDQFKPVAYEYDAARKTAARQLAESLAGYQEKYPDVTVDRELIHGHDPAHELRIVSAEAGLIVVGSRGRGELAGLVLGSIGQTLVHQARCPVAIVHPAAASTELAGAGRP